VVVEELAAAAAVGGAAGADAGATGDDRVSGAASMPHRLSAGRCSAMRPRPSRPARHASKAVAQATR
jgi:hypothetical protein